MSTIRVFIILFNILGLSLNAQNKTKLIHNISTNYHYGLITPHTDEIAFITDKPVNLIEFLYTRQTTGNKYWEKALNYPEIGYGITVGNLGNNKILGNVVALYASFQFKVIRSNYINLNIHFQPGISYLSKYYNEKDNNLNIAIGSHINVNFNLGIQSQIRLNRRFSAIIGINMTHYSNGKTNMPNKGINYVSVNTGVKYSLNAEKIRFLSPDKSIFETNEYEIILASGWKEYRRYYKSTYLISNIAFNYIRRFTEISSACIGADFFYDSSLRFELRSEGINNPGFKDIFQSGIHIGYYFNVNKTRFPLQLGRYIYSEIKPSSNFYIKFGVQRQLSKHISASLILKSHKAKADYVEWGLSYKFYSI